MSLLTNWGYTIADANALADLLTATEFGTFTANKFSGDARVAVNLAAASNAIRNHCGWHIYPSQVCEVAHAIHDYSFVGCNDGDIIVQLPARYVTAVNSVLIDAVYDSNTGWNGTACDFTFEPSGLVTIYNAFPTQHNRAAKLYVNYTAGLPDALAYAIKELIASKTTHALSSQYGISSESSGGVSITYSSNWVNSAKATALSADDKQALQAYKVGGVF